MDECRESCFLQLVESYRRLDGTVPAVYSHIHTLEGQIITWLCGELNRKNQRMKQLL
jgi:hypothetical protein